MRAAAAASLALFVLAGCSDSFESKGRWVYDSSRQTPYLDLKLEDPERSEFFGQCIRPERPAFALLGGRHDPKALDYDIEVDGRRWHVRRLLIPHDGPSLDFAEPDIVEAVGHARGSITINEGRWRRSFRASPLLARFIADCRAAQDRQAASQGRVARH